MSSATKDRFRKRLEHQGRRLQLYESSEGTQLAQPTLAPGVDLIYDIGTHTFYELVEVDESGRRSFLHKLYTYPSLSIDKPDAIEIIEKGLLPKSLSDVVANDALAGRLLLHEETIPSPLLIYHGLYDAISVQYSSKVVNKKTIKLYDYLVKHANSEEAIMTLLAYQRPIYGPYHWCSSVLRCGPGVFFCRDCQSFFKYEQRQGAHGSAMPIRQASPTKVRIMLGRIELPTGLESALLSKLSATPFSLGNSSEAVQYLQAIFKVEFSYLLPDIHPAIILSLVLKYCIYTKSPYGCMDLHILSDPSKPEWHVLKLHSLLDVFTVRNLAEAGTTALRREHLLRGVLPMETFEVNIQKKGSLHMDKKFPGYGYGAGDGDRDPSRGPKAEPLSPPMVLPQYEKEKKVNPYQLDKPKQYAYAEVEYDV
jgi:hypothetical protein